MGGLTIIGLAKLLAFGDYLNARTSHDNVTTYAGLDEEIAKYQYTRKSEVKVSMCPLFFLSKEAIGSDSYNMRNRTCSLVYSSGSN